MLPASCALTSRLNTSNSRPFTSGGHTDVWKSTDEKGQVFALRVLRTYETDIVEELYKVRGGATFIPLFGVDQSADLEIPQRGDNRQTRETPQRPVDRWRGTGVVRVLHRV